MNLKTIAAWAVARLREKSTWVGLAAVATALGAPQLGVHIGEIGNFVLVALGGGLAAAPTS